MAPTTPSGSSRAFRYQLAETSHLAKSPQPHKLALWVESKSLQADTALLVDNAALSTAKAPKGPHLRPW